MAQNWTQFRGDSGAATADENTKLPTKWDEKTNLKWRTELPGPGSSSPIVVGNKIFLTCYTGYGVSGDAEEKGDIANLVRHVICCNRDDGRIAWQVPIENKDTKDEDPFKSYIKYHGYATNTPVSDGKNLYVYLGKAGLFAFDLNGQQLWHKKIESKTNKTRWGSAASPFFFGDNLIVNAVEECGKVFSINKNDGKVVWEFDTKSNLVYSTPNLVKTKKGEMELVIGMPEKVVGIDPQTGSEKWFVKTRHENEVNASVMVDQDIVYVYGGYQSVGSVAIRSGGSGDVTESHVLWSTRDSSYVSTPVKNGKHLYWINKSGIAYCVDSANGNRLYQVRVPGVKAGKGVKFFASMIAVGNYVYAVSRESGTFILAAKPEFEVVNQNTFSDDESAFNGTPAISGNEMFMRSNKYLYCISEK